MTDKTSKSSAKKRTRLPRSGLAEEILGASDAEGEENAPQIPEPPAQTTLEVPTGPERIYEFADTLDDAGNDHGTRKVEKLETWVTFDLAAEVFALPVTHIQEILRVNTITAVPHAPQPVRGVTNKRGRVLPVVDLRTRLGLAAADPGPASRILVVESRERLLGLLVDAVNKVVRIAPSGVQAPPADVMTEQSDYILGVYDLDDTLVILLDVERVLVIKSPARAAAV